MGDDGIKLPRFFRLTTAKRSKRNEMNLPPPFMTIFGDEMPKVVKFKLPNGKETCVRFKKKDNSLKNVREFFANSPVEPKSCTVFCYLGGGMFRVYVFNENFTEVDYGPPEPVNESMVIEQDHINGIGWKFVAVVICQWACDKGVVRIPPDFWSMFGHLIPNEVSITLPNGQVFHAEFSYTKRELSGLRIFHVFDVLMFTYRGNGMFDLVLFDKSAAEKSFSLYGQRDGAMVGISWYQFKIQIRRFHLYRYCHGIDIYTAYKSITGTWAHGQFIAVHYNDNIWNLKVKKTAYMWKIHDGWIAFSKAARLKVGDVLAFDRRGCNEVFNVHVHRHELRKD